MREIFTKEQVVEMILGAAESIRANHEYLSKLDSVVGDGDHGAAMLRVADAISKTIDENKNESIKPLLEKIGWSVMGVDGGSTGPLMGSFFSGMSAAVEDSDIFDGQTLCLMFEAGLRKVRTLTKAQVGDKTMIDALVPAVEKFKIAIQDGRSLPDALQQIAQASLEGAESTKNMQAKFGRSRNLGNRTIGHIDPGSMSIAYMFAGFKDVFERKC